METQPSIINHEKKSEVVSQSSIVNRQSLILWLGLGGITLLYLALVLLRHYSFGTFAHDLGIYGQGTWQFSRFAEPYSSIKRYNLLGDHFVPILIGAVPLYWLRNGSEMLLVFQVLVIMSGAYPAWRLAQRHIANAWLQMFPPFFYALFFGHQSALDYDAHPDTFAAGFFMWAIWAFEEKKVWRYLVFLGLVAICKETTPAYIAFWAIYVLATSRQWWKLHIGLIFAGFGLFFFYLNAVVPFFAARPYFYTDYGELGKSMGDVVRNSITSPDKLFRAFFGNELKLQTWLAFFVSCGGALFIRPALLILLIPNVVERFLNPLPTRWSVYLHYNSILAPFFTYAVIQALAKYEQFRPKLNFRFKDWALGIGLIAVLLINTFLYANLLENALPDLEAIGKDRSVVWEAMRQIPPDAAVITNDRIVPHLAHRQHIDEFEPPEPPRPELSADYVLVSLEVTRTASERQKTLGYLADFRQRTNYELVFQRNETYLFKKR
jgi:uncharacterized membrane protein